MPKRILFYAFAATALVLAACNGGINPDDLYGTPVPSATLATLTPNPTATAALVEVFASDSPLPSQPVNLYNSNASAQPLGTPIATQDTNSSGEVTFTGLTAKAWYCFTSTYTGTSGLPQNASRCSDIWGSENTLLEFSI
jgi:hypothetical protein